MGRGLMPRLSSGATSFAGVVGRMVPGVVEGEVVLMSTAAAASMSPATVGLVTPLMTAAQALPVVAVTGVVGAGTGQVVRDIAQRAGANQRTSEGIGLGAAMLTGAAIGSLVPGVGSGIGAIVAGGLYLLSL